MQKKVAPRKKKTDGKRNLPTNPSAAQAESTQPVVEENAEKKTVEEVAQANPIEALKSMKGSKSKTIPKPKAKKATSAVPSKLGAITVKPEEEEIEATSKVEIQVEKEVESESLPNIVKPTRRKTALPKKQVAKKTKPTIEEAEPEKVTRVAKISKPEQPKKDAWKNDVERAKNQAKEIQQETTAYLKELKEEGTDRKEFLRNLKSETASFLEQLRAERIQRQQERLKK